MSTNGLGTTARTPPTERNATTRDQLPHVDGRGSVGGCGAISERDNTVERFRTAVRGAVDSGSPAPDTILGGGQGRTPADTLDTANALFALIAIVTVAVAAVAIYSSLFPLSTGAPVLP